VGHPDVFISYSREDVTYVEQLTRHLATAGIVAWTDRSLEAGNPWGAVIEERITECGAFLVVMSPAAKATAWVDREIDLAQELGKPILPLLLAGQRFLRLRDHQHEDVTAGQLPSRAFMESLRKRLGLPETLSENRLRRYEHALSQLANRQMHLFRERVELTVVVGGDDDHDTVVERRWTAPQPYLVYRALKPIVAWSGGPRPDPDELQLACEIHGRDIHADVSLIQDDDLDTMALVLFQPGLQDLTEWTLRYRSPGLWNPLRRTGRDHLVWSTTSPDQQRRLTLDELTLRVVFPAGWAGVKVEEEAGHGRLDVDHMPNGRTSITWRETTLTSRYHWVITGEPPLG